MKMLSFTEFRKQAAGYLKKVENGENLVILRRGKPIAEIVPYSETAPSSPSWKRPLVPLQLRGADISSAILEEREAGQ